MTSEDKIKKTIAYVRTQLINMLADIEQHLVDEDYNAASERSAQLSSNIASIAAMDAIIKGELVEQ